MRTTSRVILGSLVIAATLLAGAASVAAQPTEADVYVAEGLLALDDKQYQAALDAFRRALDRYPDHVEALYLAGVANMALGKPADAVPLLERARKNAPAQVRIAYQLGLAYMALNRQRDAEPLLESAFERDPTLDSLGYHVGFLRYQKKQYQGALKAFRANRTSDPNIAQLARVYSGLALTALGLPAQGAEEIDAAIRQQPTSPIAGPAERLRARLTEQERQGRLRASARLGFFTDDNVRAAPDPDTSATVRELRHARRQTTGELASLAVDYEWLRLQAWSATVGYSFFTTYDNDLPAFNLVDHRPVGDFTRRDAVAGMPLQSTLRYAFEYLTLGGHELLERHTVALSETLVENAANLTNLVGRVDIKDFSQAGPVPPNLRVDATNWMIGFLHFVRFEQDRHFVKAGYQYDIEDAKGRDFAYHGHRFLVGAQYTLPWKDVRLSYDAGLHYRDYTNRNSQFPENNPGTRRRSDHEWTQLARVALPLGGSATWGRFALLGDYQRIDADSNLAVDSYTRNVFTISLSWQY